MTEFYFVYDNSGKYPYGKGWTVINAETFGDACRAHKVFHPSKDGEVRWDSIYDERILKDVWMAENGTLAGRCWERINVTKQRETTSKDLIVEKVYYQRTTYDFFK